MVSRSRCSSDDLPTQDDRVLVPFFYPPKRKGTQKFTKINSQPIHTFYHKYFSGDHKQKFYWGHKEILIPVYKHMSDAIEKHKEADVVINFASLRSAEEATLDILKYPQE